MEESRFLSGYYNSYDSWDLNDLFLVGILCLEFKLEKEKEGVDVVRIVDYICMKD